MIFLMSVVPRSFRVNPPFGMSPARRSVPRYSGHQVCGCSARVSTSGPVDGCKRAAWAKVGEQGVRDRLRLVIPLRDMVVTRVDARRGFAVILDSFLLRLLTSRHGDMVVIRVDARRGFAAMMDSFLLRLLTSRCGGVIPATLMILIGRKWPAYAA